MLLTTIVVLVLEEGGVDEVPVRGGPFEKDFFIRK